MIKKTCDSRVKASLAPMAGVSDRSFREICALFGASSFTSEMISAKALIYGNAKTTELLSRSQNGIPFAAQLFGSDPATLAEAAEIISGLEPRVDAIDINMGCPVAKIVKDGSGSALMKNPRLCGEIVKAVKLRTDIPVTVKIRSGWDKNSITAVQTAKECEFNGASAITVHGRTREQAYSGKVDLKVIKEVANAVNITVIANGDVLSAADAQAAALYVGSPYVAVGRGALGNPWIFSEINLTPPGETFKPPSIRDKISVMRLHMDKIIKYKGENIGIKEARKHLAWYVKGLRGAANLRDGIFKMNTLEDFDDLCRIALN